MNKVILSGNLCHDIELKKTPNGKSVLTNCIAVQREYKNEQGKYDSDFINLVVWGAQTDYLSLYGHKGDRVELVGRWQVRKYQSNEGSNRTANECVVESIRVFSKAPKEEKTEPELNEIPESEDLPF